MTRTGNGFWAFAATLALCSACAPAQAQPPFLICKAIKNDADRLKCYDGAVAALQALSESLAADRNPIWQVKSDRAPLDDKPQVVANLKANDGAGAILILRCLEQRTDALFYPTEFKYYGKESKKVLYRLNQETPKGGMWTPSSDGRALFSVGAVDFIKALQDDANLFMRAHDDKGHMDATFSLGQVSVVRDQLAQACAWDRPAPKPKR